MLAPCLWRALLRWHGSAVREGISLPRRVVPGHYLNESESDSGLVVELYPLTLLILRHTTSSGNWLQTAFGLSYKNFSIARSALLTLRARFDILVTRRRSFS